VPFCTFFVQNVYIISAESTASYYEQHSCE